MIVTGRRFIDSCPIEVSTDGATIIGVRPLHSHEDNRPWIAPGLLDLQVNGFGGNEFAKSLSIYGDRLAIGARHDYERAFRAGAVLLYRWDGAAWQFERKIFAPDASERALFGNRVDLEGNMLVVGARDYTTDDGTKTGAAYLANLEYLP